MAISGNSRLAAARAAQLPSAVTVARYPRYEEAQASVDLLAERGFPIQHLSIVGSDLRQVEYVVGALSYAKVAASGALQGLFYGVMLALLLVLFTGDAWLSAFLTAVPLGIAFWVILTVITYSRRGSSRNFTAVGQLVAGTYELVCIPQEAGEARRLLGGQAARGPLRPTSEQQPGAPAPRPTAEAPSAPPAFGQRAEAGERPAEPSQARDFADLPDGRPRFGLREDEDAAAPVAADRAARGESAPSRGSSAAGGSTVAGGSTDAGAPDRRPAEAPSAAPRQAPAGEDDAGAAPSEGERRLGEDEHRAGEGEPRVGEDESPRPGPGRGESPWGGSDEDVPPRRRRDGDGPRT